MYIIFVGVISLQWNRGRGKSLEFQLSIVSVALYFDGCGCGAYKSTVPIIQKKKCKRCAQNEHEIKKDAKKTTRGGKLSKSVYFLISILICMYTYNDADAVADATLNKCKVFFLSYKKIANQMKPLYIIYSRTPPLSRARALVSCSFFSSLFVYFFEILATIFLSYVDILACVILISI